MKNNVVDIGQVEKNSRKRDFTLEELKFALEHGGIPQDLLENAMAILGKGLNNQNLFIGTKRSPQSKVRFAQHLQENLGYLYEKKYLTDREKIFLADIVPYIAFSSNCIVLDIKAKNPIPANISEISELIKSNRSNTSVVINSLKKKGIIAKAESGVEGNNAKAYAIFLNPHVLFAGDKDNVNETLKSMFTKAMRSPVLKGLPDKLF